MASPKNRITSAILFAFSLSLVCTAVPCYAQAPARSSGAHPLETDNPTAAPAADAILAPSTTASAAWPTAAPAVTTDPVPSNPEPQTSGAPSSSSSYSSDDRWRAKIAIYGWFAGVHGTVGVLDHDAGFNVPFSDLFHYLKGIIPIAADVEKGHFVMPIDYLWMKLGDDKGIPFSDPLFSSVNIHLTESIFTPKVGYRLYNAEHFKVDALGGIRYWYIGQNLTLEPSGPSVSKSVNWVDGLGGARFILPLNERAAVTISGDAGAGGANLDYQLLGLFNFDLTRRIGLGLGWRYLDVHYRPGNHQAVYDSITSGALGGLYFNLGGNPPVPPAASCAVQPSEIMVGEPVTATASASNFNPKHTLSYAWSSTSGKVASHDNSATIDTVGLAGGTYHVTANITDAKMKKGGATSCTASFTAKEPPKNPPTMSCSARPASLTIGESASVTCTCNSPDQVPVTISNWSATSGTVSGSGSGATLSTAGAEPGTSTVTATCSDSRGLTAQSSTRVSMAAPPTKLVAKLTIGRSVYFPTAKPSPLDPDGGLEPSQLKTLTEFATDFKTYLQYKPDAQITLDGHADQRGSAAYNQALSERRVARTKNFLVEQGVPAANIQTQALGDQHNLTPAEVKEQLETNPDLTQEEKDRISKRMQTIIWASNRRVDISLNGSGQQSVRHLPFHAEDALTIIGGRTSEVRAAPKKPVKKQ
jgi:outer membrane protein OmpA-like peptidoglycan-associated protein